MVAPSGPGTGGRGDWRRGTPTTRHRSRLVVLIGRTARPTHTRRCPDRTADCGTMGNSHWPAPDGGCGASCLGMLGCSETRESTPGPTRVWRTCTRRGQPALSPPAGHPGKRTGARRTPARVNEGQTRRGQWAHALDRAPTRTHLINDLLTGALDTCEHQPPHPNPTRTGLPCPSPGTGLCPPHYKHLCKITLNARYADPVWHLAALEPPRNPGLQEDDTTAPVPRRVREGDRLADGT